MIVSLQMKRDHPSPWVQCKPFFKQVGTLLFDSHQNSNRVSTTVIKARQSWAEVKAYDECRKLRLDHDQKMKEIRQKLESEINAVGNEQVQTDTTGQQFVPLAQFLPILTWIQGLLGGYCQLFRRIKFIFIWEDSITSFWITLATLVTGGILLIIPCGIILHWTCRIAIWTFLGPWMKIVDSLLYQDSVLHSKSKDEKERRTEEAFKEIVSALQGRSKAARLVGEEVTKSKAFKTLLFGEYITNVPYLERLRHIDVPLPESMAQPYSAREESSFVRDTGHIPGQHLCGVMIPMATSSIPESESGDVLGKTNILIEVLRLIADNTIVQNCVKNKKTCKKPYVCDTTTNQIKKETTSRAQSIDMMSQSADDADGASLWDAHISHQTAHKEPTSLNEVPRGNADTPPAIASSSDNQRDDTNVKRIDELEEQGLEVVLNLNDENDIFEPIEIYSSSKSRDTFEEIKLKHMDSVTTTRSVPLTLDQTSNGHSYDGKQSAFWDESAYTLFRQGSDLSHVYRSSDCVDVAFCRIREEEIDRDNNGKMKVS